MTVWLLFLFRLFFVLFLYLFLIHVLRLMYLDLFREKRMFYSLRPGTLVLKVKESSDTQVAKGESYVLTESTTIIGRDTGCDLVIRDSHVSGRHALIARRGGKWEIRDLGSKNGTYVNGVRIQGPVDLLPGMEIRIGRVTLEVGWENASRRAYPYRMDTPRE